MSWEKKNGFSLQEIQLADDYEGAAKATLIIKKADMPIGKSILYIHGFVDYFFQAELANWANELGIDFYAMDLRKYGRSHLPHQKPNNFRHFSEYFEELDKAIEIIQKDKKENGIILMGHSTGGLIGSLYAHERRSASFIEALILNSPFFDMNVPTPVKKLVVPMSAAIGRIFPDIASPEGLKEGYPRSIHKDFHGEWDFDLRFKPIEGFPLNLGWINAIHQAQKKLQRGLQIPCPVLVMYSDKSVTPGDYQKDMHTADAVLSVKDIARFAKVIGNNIHEVEIPDGIHDLVLSRKAVRKMVYDEMSAFLKTHLIQE